MNVTSETERVRAMNFLFKRLKAEEQQRLISALEENILLAEAARLDASVDRSDSLPKLSMQDIVKECRISREEIHARQKFNS
jgi:hypothetical protein